jgi:uncharacterized membrane protein
MKHLFLFIVFLTSAITFAQTDATIKGNVLDAGDNNAPLEMAHVTIDETGSKTTSDQNGDFVFENLTPGTYTLSLSFVGYETKKMEVQVLANRTTQIKEVLNSSTLSLEDLMLTFASSDATETPVNIANR